VIIARLRRIRDSKLVARDRALTTALEIICWWEARR
jgi:hypothetical protein